MQCIFTSLTCGIASLSFDGRIHPLAKLTLSAGPEVLLTDSRYTRTFFGVTEGQAAIADIAPYDAKSGIDMVRFGVGADYALTPHWMLALMSRTESCKVMRPIAQSKERLRKAAQPRYVLSFSWFYGTIHHLLSTSSGG